MNEKDFIIDQTIIDIELCNLASTMIRYAQEETELKLKVESKDAELDKVKADLDDFFRISKKEEKPTEARIKSLIFQNENYQKVNMELMTLAFKHNMAKWCMSALQAKKDCLVALAYRDRQLQKADSW